MEFSDFLLNVIPVLLLEILAAIAGIFYLKKVNSSFEEKVFVGFLWFSVSVEILNSYAALAYFSDYTFLGFIKDTPFRNNYWLGNIQLLVSNVVYVYFFGSLLRNKKTRRLLSILTVTMIIAVFIDFFVSDFFNSYSRVSTIFGSLLVLLSILLFYLYLLTSEKLLNLQYYLPIYISVALLIYTLCISPLDFLSNYFKTSTGNQLFVSFKVYTLFILNILLYLTYTFAFILCSRKRNLSY